MAGITVEYIDHLGDDLRVANAARVSFNKQSELECVVFDTQDEAEAYGELDYEYVSSDRWFGGYPASRLGEKDQRLIRYLATHNHFTPFTHCMITLRETVPIFVARQRFKHMVGFTYNEVSRRYVDDEPEFYIPDVWRSRPEGSVKQGSCDKPIDTIIAQSNEEGYFQYPENIKDAYNDYLSSVSQLYNDMLNTGVAPEQARMVLPQSMMTSYYVTGSLAAFARAYKQRIDPHAQKEIQDLAVQWDKCIRPLFPKSWEALVEQSNY